MRERASHERGVQHPRQNEIGDIPPAPGEQAAILAARHGTPDELLALKLSHGTSLSRIQTRPWQTGQRRKATLGMQRSQKFLATSLLAAPVGPHPVAVSAL